MIIDLLILKSLPIFILLQLLFTQKQNQNHTNLMVKIVGPTKTNGVKSKHFEK